MLDKILKKQIDENKIFHAYIFEGSNSLVQAQYKAFAKELYSKETNIDINNLVELIEAENENISIEQIRDLNRKVFNKPYKLKYNLYVIKDAHFMRTEAQNAMLKTLEDLPSYSIIILLTNNRYKLLDTIISRCQLITLEGKNAVDLDSELSKNTIHLLKEALSNKYYFINKEKNLLKELSNSKSEFLNLLSKIFIDAKFTDRDTIENREYKNLLNRLDDFLISEVEELLIKIEKIRGLLDVKINFQLAIEDLFLTIMKINKKAEKRKSIKWFILYLHQ